MTDISLCRLCANAKYFADLIHIQDPSYAIESKVSQCCQIVLSDEELLPENACTDCLAGLNACMDFIKGVINAQETLKNSFINKNSPDKYGKVLDVYVLNDLKNDNESIKSKRKSKSPIKRQDRHIPNVESPQEHYQLKYETDDANVYEITEVEIVDQRIKVEVFNEIDPQVEYSEYDDGDEFLEEEEVQNKGETETSSVDKNDILVYINEHIKEQTDDIEIQIDGEKYIKSTLTESDKNADGTISEEGLKKLSIETWESYPWRCTECERHFETVVALRSHFLVTHKTTIKYGCADCDDEFTKYLSFLNHVRRQHHTHLKYCCDVCFAYFWDLKLLRKHCFKHSDDWNRIYKCEICSKGFQSRTTLLNHRKSHHPPCSEIKSQRYECEICDKKFSSKPNLIIHKRIHTGIREYVCDTCGKSFVQKGNLENHLITHLPLWPFVCEVCKKSFKTQIRLNNHSTVHSGLKPHRCTDCGKEFREKATLREHKRIHTGAMPFSCKYCSKKFRFKGILTTHLRLHTGERPYSCLKCNHHFTNWSNFNKHMKRRHNINTSKSVRKPQKIPPSGMPPEAKQNHIVPTEHNSLKHDANILEQNVDDLIDEEHNIEIDELIEGQIINETVIDNVDVEYNSPIITVINWPNQEVPD